MGYLRRAREPFELVVRRRRVEQIQTHGSWLKQGFRLRLDGTLLTARWMPRTRFDTPPYFRGLVEPAGDGFRVHGVIRESRTASVYTAVYGFATVLMVAVVLGTVFSGQWPGYVIGACALAAAVGFALLWRTFRRTRRAEFGPAAAKLRRSLSTYLRDGRV